MAEPFLEFADIDPAGSDLWALGWRAVMAELRDHLDDDQIAEDAASLRHEGYVATAAVLDGVVVAAAGWRMLTTLHGGHHLYVDDLVTATRARSAGHGAALLTHLEERARAVGAVGMRLDSGVQRLDAHRFYEREGWHKASWSFRKALS